MRTVKGFSILITLLCLFLFIGCEPAVKDTELKVEKPPVVEKPSIIEEKPSIVKEKPKEKEKTRVEKAIELEELLKTRPKVEPEKPRPQDTRIVSLEVSIIRTGASSPALTLSCSPSKTIKDQVFEFEVGQEVEINIAVTPPASLGNLSSTFTNSPAIKVTPRPAQFGLQVFEIKALSPGQSQLTITEKGRGHKYAIITLKSIPAVPVAAKTLGSLSGGGMEVLLLIIICGGGFLLAYHTYGHFLANKIFKLDKNAPVPSHELQDGIDYVPAKKGIIFGHHYTSIAGTGPIVGPAIGIIWGWVPAILWVVFGSIFMGAVHDLGALVVSMRNEGKSISDITAKYINGRVRFIFFIIVFLALLIVIAIFGMVIAIVFDRFPSSVIPVWLQIPIAVTLGFAVYKKGAKVVTSTVVAVIAMYLCIWLGSLHSDFKIPEFFGIPATGVWTIILLAYAWVASTLPVTTLLQPRDYINAWQLFIIMGFLVVGAAASAITGGMEIVAPVLNLAPEGAPSLWPFLFITIACGAVSGFHSLVASGTSPKQISNEKDCLFIGYGSMLLEGALAILIILCVAAGIGMAYKTGTGEILSGSNAWNHHYASWAGAKGMDAKLGAVVIGASNMMQTLGIKEIVGITLMGVFIASFAGTTLDTSVRIQRYIIAELATDLKLKPLANRWVATTIAVVTAAALAFATGANGKGALKLWPLFGAANQLLAALALLIVTLYLKRKGGMKFLVSGIPCVLMLVITNWAMVENEIIFYNNKDWLLVTIGGGIFALALWMAAEAFLTFIGKEKPANPI